MSEPGPAFYARRGSATADWWTLLHPPYTAWHLSYVVVGSTLTTPVDWRRAGAATVSFLLGMGVSAHAFDELAGRPLGTDIPSPVLVAVGSGSLALAAALGIAVAGRAVVPWAAAGAVLVLGYNLELAGGVLHNDVGFAAAWGAFPVLAAASVQPAGLGVASGLAAGAAFALSLAQRRLSTPARRLRREVAGLTGEIRYADGRVDSLDRDGLLEPLEGTLRALTWAATGFAAALAVSRALRS